MEEYGSLGKVKQAMTTKLAIVINCDHLRDLMRVYISEQGSSLTEQLYLSTFIQWLRNNQTRLMEGANEGSSRERLAEVAGHTDDSR